MKFNNIIALLLIACASLTSCLKGEYRVSGFVTFANVADETHLTGDGNASYLITENGTDSKFTEVESKRIIMNCDLLDMNSPQSIKLNAYQEVKVKPAVPSDASSVETFCRDSVYVPERARYVSTNGDNVYVTLYVSVPKLKDSKAEHTLELVFGKTSDAKELRFTLYHDANGDIITKETPTAQRSSEEYYISFNIQDFLKGMTLTRETKFTITTAFDEEKEKSENK